ncbi:OmpA family protein [Aquicoccus sp.]|uniref:OmpA family protein n=1 Tax=Aquicoccus sp. TaxID=2055851 RepID=UPI0035618F62
MRLSSILIIAGTFATAGLACLFTAGFAVTMIEENSEIEVRRALDDQGLTWAEVHADGLQVFLTGTAQSEASRFLAVSSAGTVVDAARVIDHMDVAASKGITPPRFSIEILRNDSGISLIGLVPAASKRDDILDRLKDIGGDENIVDLLETADYPLPDGWETAIGFGLEALEDLPRSKISIDAERVEITAMVDRAETKRNLELALARATPRGLDLVLDISAPLPVITPFSLRFVIDESGPRFDNCSADSEAARDRIIAAARAAGVTGQTSCTIGLGVPSPKWARAAELSIAALDTIGNGSVTFADADISLVADENTDPGLFDETIGELETALPDVFTVHAVLPQPAEPDDSGPREFVATLSPEGLVQMRGRVSDELVRQTIISFARARFGSDAVHNAARVDDSLPPEWTVRVLAGIEALSKLSNGAVTVSSDRIAIKGNTGDSEARSMISRLLSEKLGEAARFEIDVTYQEELDPVAALPTPEECAEQIEAIQAERKISFEPGSDTIDTGARETLDEIADILKECGPIHLEIAGHTDSQGREVMNQQLSQARAQSVLNGLRERRVLTSTFSAVGYGETQPIADNDTEEGREANRRIEFRIASPETTEEMGIPPLIIEQDINADPETETDDTASQDEDTPDDTN